MNSRFPDFHSQCPTLDKFSENCYNLEFQSLKKPHFLNIEWPNIILFLVRYYYTYRRKITNNHPTDRRNKVSLLEPVRIITQEGFSRGSREAEVSVQSYIFLEQRTYIRHAQDTYSSKFRRGIRLQNGRST